MQLVITIDTEEDNWARYSTTDNPVSNIERLIPLQKLFDQHGVRPTYLVTYPVATNPRSVEILKNFLDHEKCEIGMHCHPWNTPPLPENTPIADTETMLCNLDANLVHEKMTTLHEAIRRNFGIKPLSFRSGRWGFGPAVARSLVLLGYRVDSSVSPYVDWSSIHGPDYRSFSPAIFSFGSNGFRQKTENDTILEVPATIGFLQRNFSFAQRITQMVENPLGKLLHLKGVLYHTHLVNKIWLSPEQSEISAMFALTKRMRRKNFPYVNFTFHSTSLKAGHSPFVQTGNDERRFMEKIKQFLQFTRKIELQNLTLAETAAAAKNLSQQKSLKNTLHAPN